MRVQKSAAIGGKKAGRRLLGVIKIECNADEHMEKEEERAAKLIWVGVANSTKHKLKIKWSVSGARRVKKPSKLSIPDLSYSCSRNPVQFWA